MKLLGGRSEGLEAIPDYHAMYEGAEAIRRLRRLEAMRKKRADRSKNAKDRAK